MILPSDYHNPPLKRSEFYIDDGTNDLANIPADVKPKSTALDIKTGDLWLKYDATHWRKFGSDTIYPAEV